MGIIDTILTATHSFLAGLRQPAQHRTIVERTPRRRRQIPDDGRIYSCIYAPLPAEKRFYAQNGKHAMDTVLQERIGQLVGWFGIVRECRDDSLLVEMRYFFGRPYSRHQTVSQYGAGDFTARLTDPTLPIRPLSLVAVYGTVVEEIDRTPVLQADYIRVFDWGQFSFWMYGEDLGNPAWRIAGLEKSDIMGYAYSQGGHFNNPPPEYYERLLGRRPSELQTS